MPRTTKELCEQLKGFQRLAIGGGSKTGKSTLGEAMAALTGATLVHTDDWLEGGPYWDPERIFDEVPEAVLRRCPPGRLIVEGVRAVGVLRAGLEVDCLAWLRGPHVPLSFRQDVQRKGRETDFARYCGSQPSHRVIVFE
jgi:hypothetical protein